MNKIDVKYHIGFWIVKWSIIFFFFHIPTRHEVELFWIASPLVLIFHTAYFYGIYSFIFPRYFERKKYLDFGISLAILTVIHSLGLGWIWSGFSNVFLISLKPYFSGFIASNFIFLSIAFTWKYLNYLISESNKKFALKKIQKQSELKFLQSQINPHFLFNVLGCINGLSITKSDKTEVAITNLTTLINSSAKMKAGKPIDLFDELAFLRSYIELQEMRFSMKANTWFPILIPHQLEIKPLFILPLLENAFLHGDLNDSENFTIKFKIRKNVFSVFIRNKIASDEENKVGNGLIKLKSRLDLEYPNRYEFSHEQIADNYVTQLKLELDVWK